MNFCCCILWTVSLSTMVGKAWLGRFMPEFVLKDLLQFSKDF
jgi:hypothetical protein